MRDRAGPTTAPNYTELHRWKKAMFPDVPKCTRMFPCTSILRNEPTAVWAIRLAPRQTGPASHPRRLPRPHLEVTFSLPTFRSGLPARNLARSDEPRALL